MTRKQVISLTAVLPLVCVFLFAGCSNDQDSKPQADVWSRVQSVEEIYGRWEGSTVIDVPEIPVGMFLSDTELPAEYLPFIPETLPASSVGMLLKWTVQLDSSAQEVTLDFNGYLDDAVGPLLKPTVWSIIRAAAADFLVTGLLDDSVMPGEDFSFELKDNYKAVVSSETGGEMQFDDETELYINQHRNKLKMPLDPPQEEIILYKK